MCQLDFESKHVNSDSWVVAKVQTVHVFLDLVVHMENGCKLGSRLYLRACSLSKEEREAKAKGILFDRLHSKIKFSVLIGLM